MFHPFHGLAIFVSDTSVAGSDARAKSHSKDARSSQESQEAPGSCWKWQGVSRVLWFPPPEHRETIIRLGNHKSDSNKCLDDFCNGVVVFSPHKDSVLIYHWIVQQTCGFWRFLLTTKRVFLLLFSMKAILGIQEFGVAKTDRNL